MIKQTLVGASRQHYSFEPRNPFYELPDLPGLYVFGAPGNSLLGGGMNVVYVGETVSLKARLTGNHHKWPTAQMKFPGVRIYSMVFIGTEVERKAVERDLIAVYRPPLNDLLKPPPGLFGLASAV